MDSSLFAQLPRELRDQIYELATPTHCDFLLSLKMGHVCLKPTSDINRALALTSTCKQVRDEALPIVRQPATSIRLCIPQIVGSKKFYEERAKLPDQYLAYDLSKAPTWWAALYNFLGQPRQVRPSRLRSIDLHLCNCHVHITGGSVLDHRAMQDRLLSCPSVTQMKALDAAGTRCTLSLELSYHPSRNTLKLQIHIGTNSAPTTPQAYVQQTFSAEGRRLAADRANSQLTTYEYSRMMGCLQKGRNFVHDLVKPGEHFDH